MPTLLLEIGCEELPASACREAEAQLPELCRRHLSTEPARVLVGPRRLAVLVEDLPERAPDWVRRGPAERVAFDGEGRPTKAAEGFARSAGLSVAELERRDGNVWARVAGEELAASLPARVQEIVNGLAFGKSMRWEPGGRRFSRPVRWLCGKLDSSTVEGTGGTSFGHRFTAGRVDVPGAEAYEETLRAAGVEPDAAERRRLIMESMDALGDWSDPLGKLDEVVYLVESPIVLQAGFDERFLRLPRRVIETAMQSHQRYFPQGGNHFLFVANGGDPEVVRSGNVQVLEGRLEDATFTWERDLAVGIDGLRERLASITFFTGAGSFADKGERLVQLVGELGGDEDALTAAGLAKVDQAAELVREFPDLEGHIGAEYARAAGYGEAVCVAVDEQYLPDSAGGPLPATQAGRVLAAADRIDTLRVAFSLGQRPSGSRDPYGLRRAAIGLCRLAVEGGIRVPLALLGSHELRLFVEERLEGLLDVPVEFHRAARQASVPDLARVAQLARALAALDEERLRRIHTVYTRADRIVHKAADGDMADLRLELLSDGAERDVFDVLRETEQTLLDEQEPAAKAAHVERLAEPLERFFDEVLVLADDPDVRRNRLRLLYDVRALVRHHVGDLAELPL